MKRLLIYALCIGWAATTVGCSDDDERPVAFEVSQDTLLSLIHIFPITRPNTLIFIRSWSARSSVSRIRFLSAAARFSGCGQAGNENLSAVETFPLTPSREGTETVTALIEKLPAGYEEDTCFNVTPESISEKYGFTIYKYDASCASFLMYEEAVYPLGEWFGGYGATSFADVYKRQGNCFFPNILSAFLSIYVSLQLRHSSFGHSAALENTVLLLDKSGCSI